MGAPVAGPHCQSSTLAYTILSTLSSSIVVLLVSAGLARFIRHPLPVDHPSSQLVTPLAGELIAPRQKEPPQPQGRVTSLGVVP
jgi:hypothetical protein